MAMTDLKTQKVALEISEQEHQEITEERNENLNSREIESSIRNSIKKGVPYGRKLWVNKTIKDNKL